MPSITVYVKDPSGNPIPASVIIADDWGKPLNSYQTDAQGRAVISFTEGRYLFKAEKEGFLPSQTTFATVGKEIQIELWLQFKPTVKPKRPSYSPEVELRILKAQSDKLTKRIELFKLSGKDTSVLQTQLKNTEDAIKKWEAYLGKQEVKKEEEKKPEVAPQDKQYFKDLEVKRETQPNRPTKTIQLPELRISEASRSLLAKFFKKRRRRR